MSAILIIVYLFLLLASQRLMTTQATKLIHRLGGGQTVFIWLWSLVFLPGTIIHEVSHLLLAAATGAKAGNVVIFPEFIADNFPKKGAPREIKLGSVMVQKMNPVQGFFVGLAPLFSGLALLVWLASKIQLNLQNGVSYLLALQVYFFFVIANSLFPSWADIKHTLPLTSIMISLGILAWLLGLNILVSPQSQIWSLLDSLQNALAASVVLNLLLTGILLALRKIV